MTLFCEVVSLTVFLVLAIVLSLILLMTSKKYCPFISLFSTNIFLYYRTLKTYQHNFAFFLQTVNAIEKLLEAFIVQLKNGMNHSLI